MSVKFDFRFWFGSNRSELIFKQIRLLCFGNEKLSGKCGKKHLDFPQVPQEKKEIYFKASYIYCKY